MTTEENNKTPSFPWSYTGSIIFFSAAVLAGFVIEFLTGGAGIVSPSYPFNLITLAELMVLIPLAYVLYRRKAIVKWLSSVPAAIATIMILTILVLLMGFIPAESIPAKSVWHRLGFDHLFHSWPYLIASLQLVFVLGLTIVKRIFPVNIRNISFFLNHFGLWLVLVSASLGTGELKRLNFYLFTNNTTNIAFDKDMNPTGMPFSLTLKQFTIEEYSPEIVPVNNKTGKTEKIKGNKAFTPEKDKTFEWKKYKCSVLKYIPYALKQDPDFVASDSAGAVAAAFISVDNGKPQWICSQNYYHLPALLKIDSSYSLMLTVPKAKEYRSDITLSAGECNKDFSLEVNKPVTVEGWELYQSGYDEKKGKWSDLSIIEVVRDPWLPVVYAGIFLLLAGSTMMFLMGKRKTETTT